MKKLILLIVLILVSVAGVYLYRTYFKEESIAQKEIVLYKAIPASSPVFMEVSGIKELDFSEFVDYDRLENKSGIFYQNQVSRVQELIASHKIPGSLRSTPFVLAFGFAGDNTAYPLVIMRAGKNKQKNLEKLFGVCFPVDQYQFSEEQYSKERIVSVKNTKGQAVFHYAFTRGYFLGSSNNLLVEESIRQIDVGNSAIVTHIREKSTQLKQGKNTVYINHDALAELMAFWVNPKREKYTNEFGETVVSSRRNNSREFKNFASWSQLNIDEGKTRVLFTGSSFAGDSLNHYLSVLKGQESGRMKSDKMLPADTEMYFCLNLARKKIYFERLAKFFTYKPNYYKRQDRIRKLERKLKLDMEDKFTSWLKSEITLASTPKPGNSMDRNNYFLMEISDGEKNHAELEQILGSYYSRAGINMETIKSSYSTSNGDEYSIYSFPYPSLPGLWLGHPFLEIKARYLTVIEDYLVFADSKNGLEEYIDAIVGEKTLLADEGYRKYKAQAGNRSCISVYVNPGVFHRYGQDLFEKDILSRILSQKDVLNGFGATFLQLSFRENQFHSLMSISKKGSASNEGENILAIDTYEAVEGSPGVVKNHGTGNWDEVVFYDRANLYLANAKGKLLWSVKIGEPVMSDIHQIDYLRNGRLQYLFNTKNKLHLIDRNGNNVAPFPIDLEYDASNGVAVFDYDRNRNYRFFIAGYDKRIHVYDKSGKEVKGWQFGQSSQLVVSPVEHTRIAGRDYILFHDGEKLYVLHRNGKTRVEYDQKRSFSENPPVIDLTSEPRVILSGERGELFIYYFDGRSEEKKFRRFDEKHKLAVGDLNANGLADFVFCDGRELTVIEEGGEVLFKEKFRKDISETPVLFKSLSGDNNKWIGVVEGSANRIHLIDQKGKEHPSFPLSGNTMFDLIKIDNNTWKACVGNRSGGVSLHVVKTD